ncbi:unnamed protein product, partial [Meganyctiphanes norvegica]
GGSKSLRNGQENGSQENGHDGDADHTGGKRRSGENDDHDHRNAYGGGGPNKRRKMGPPQPKNPISTLNELRPGLEYTTESVEGPSHAPVFTVTIDLNGHIFKGTGRNKRQAKHAAAEATLRSFLQVRCF